MVVQNSTEKEKTMIYIISTLHYYYLLTHLVFKLNAIVISTFADHKFINKSYKKSKHCQNVCSASTIFNQYMIIM